MPTWAWTIVLIVGALALALIIQAYVIALT
jgi:hypothetical protein